MTNWIENGAIAVVMGGLFFLAGFVPGLLWQFRRFGGFNASRMLGLAAVCLYGTALFAYTFLPLPDRSQAWCDANAAAANLRPFQFSDDIRTETVGLPLLEVARSFPVLQVAFNVLLFVPFGIIVRRYFHRSALTAVALGAAVSLLIELSQYTGLWGIYPCAFRVADVDDFIVNTAGAALGAALAPVALFWMPTAATLRERRLTPRPVTTIRRWLGMALDLALIVTITLGIQAVVAVARGVIGGSTETAATLPLAFIVAWVIVFLLPAWQGASIGQRTVWLAPKWREGDTLTDGTRLQRLAHASVIPGVCAALLAVDAVEPQGLSVLTFGVAIIAFAVVPFTRTKRGLSGVLTGAEMRDAREADSAEGFVDTSDSAVARG